jgi:hypothetical protein
MCHVAVRSIPTPFGGRGSNHGAFSRALNTSAHQRAMTEDRALLPVGQHDLGLPRFRVGFGSKTAQVILPNAVRRA